MFYISDPHSIFDFFSIWLLLFSAWVVQMEAAPAYLLKNRWDQITPVSISPRQQPYPAMQRNSDVRSRDFTLVWRHNTCHNIIVMS